MGVVAATGELIYHEVVGHAFNAVVFDGGFGLLSMGGQTSLDSFTLRTDDPAYLPIASAGSTTLAGMTDYALIAGVDPTHQLATSPDAARPSGGALDFSVQAADRLLAYSATGGEDMADRYSFEGYDMMRFWPDVGSSHDLLYAAWGFDPVKAYDSKDNDTAPNSDSVDFLMLDEEWNR